MLGLGYYHWFGRLFHFNTAARLLLFLLLFLLQQHLLLVLDLAQAHLFTFQDEVLETLFALESIAKMLGISGAYEIAH